MIAGGLVLCGGHSRRMGQPKAWLPIGNETMLQRVVRILGSRVTKVVVCAAEGQELPELPVSVVVVRDELPDCGPLAGIARGLCQFEDNDCVFVTACDVPLLTPTFVDYLLLTLNMRADIDLVIPEIEGKLHPLSAVYRGRVGRTAARMIMDGELRARAIVDRVPHLRITKGVDLESLWNINTPEEYEELFSRDA